MIAWVLGLVVWIVPIWLSPDPQVPRPPEKKPPKRGAPERKVRTPRFEPQDVKGLDREAFLASFSRQAGRELVPCLIEHGEPTGRVSFVARLSSAGQLTDVRALRSLGSANECAKEAIEKMSFANLKVPDETIEVEWTFSW